MQMPPTSSHRPVFSPKAPISRLLPRLALLLIGFASASQAMPDVCAPVIAQKHLPSGAEAVMRDPRVSINGLPLCVASYLTDQSPEQIIAHYRHEWAGTAYREVFPQALDDAANDGESAIETLFYSRQATRHVSARSTPEGTTVMLSVMRLGDALDSDRRQSQAGAGLIPPAMERLYHQSNRHGDTTVIEGHYPIPRARERLGRYLARRGWVETTAPTNAGHGVSMSHTRLGAIEVEFKRRSARTVAVIHRIEHPAGNHE
ncbi:hypothetical protein V6X62_06810 [Spiribacter sp. 218]|uniref:hypothetical protein n=1 Tax=Spiribacter pallidus TaxID=1987936 RepID=UPI00349F2884